MAANSKPTNTAVLPGDSSTYSVKEIAVILGISKKSAYMLCEKNCFISKRIGRIIRINKKSFEEWLNSRSS